MEEFKPTLCIVCLEVKNDENCRVVEETIEDILRILLFERPIEVNTSMICNACCTKVFEAFEFKTVCKHTEDSIFPYVDSSNGAPVDLKEIYLKEKGEEQLRSVAEDEKICRLCLQIATSECTPVRDLEVDLICKYIPEVNFNTTEDPIICKGCVDTLKTHGGFLRKHFDVHNFQNISKDETKQGQFYIKMEEIQIKSEEDDRDSDTLPPTDQSAVCKNEDEDSLKSQPHTTNRSNVKCNLIHHRLKHEMLSAVPSYKCDMCNYIAKRKDNLVNHQLRHKDVSEVQMHKCSACSFKTKYKSALVMHQLRRHKDISTLQMFKCDRCSFATKHRDNLAHHQLKHKDVSKVQMYKCNECGYETKCKGYLIQHELRHKNVSEIQMYKCNMCSFETKRKKSLVHHELRHKDASEVRMYKCNECSYKTKYKRYLVKHQLTHKNVSETQIFSCRTCNYKTKRRENLARHQKTHKDVSEMQIYKCDSSSHKSN